MDLDRHQLLQALADQRTRLRGWGVQRLGLFGSVARNEAGPDSDLDFVVDFEPGRKTFDNYMDLKYFLEQLCGRTIDLVTSEGLKPQLRDRILSETIYAPGL
ncbi:MAG TPA: nucleotidyltransferase family protein [Thermoanaerobaculia bacterium]|nr:nucleotidyltransferase family protein [Thermoanaerobaculia bacterium]